MEGGEAIDAVTVLKFIVTKLSQNPHLAVVRKAESVALDCVAALAMDQDQAVNRLNQGEMVAWLQLLGKHQKNKR